jgi:hypothetical protein
MVKIDGMETQDDIKINGGPSETAVIGSGLKTKNLVAVVLKKGYVCPIVAATKGYKKTKKEGPDTAANPIDPLVTVYQPASSSVLDRRYPISIEPLAGALSGLRAVAMQDTSKPGVVLVACKDDAINLVD